MPTDSYKVGPGTLTLGTDPDDAEFSMQITSCRVEPTENVDSGDDLNLLDGSTLDGEDNVSYDYVLAGTAVQDLATNGFVDYCWDNKGDEVAFVFVPNTARAASVTGTVRIAPVTIGGDAKTRPTSDFSFACIGEPVYAPDATP